MSTSAATPTSPIPPASRPSAPVAAVTAKAEQGAIQGEVSMRSSPMMKLSVKASTQAAA